MSECIPLLLDYSIETCDPESLRSALRLGYDPNEVDENNKTVLMRCIDLDNSDMIKAVLSTNKADVNKGTDLADSPLHYAAMNNKLVAAETLLQEAGNDLRDKAGKDKRTPLMIALEGKHSSMADLLRKHGRNPQMGGGPSNDPKSIVTTNFLKRHFCCII